MKMNKTEDRCTPYRSSASRIGLTALWSVGILAAVSAHAGAIALLMRAPLVTPAEDPGAPAMMIDMAALPEAVNTDQNSQTEQLEDAVEVKTETPPDPQPEPEPVIPEPVVEDPPPPEPVVKEEPTPEPIEETPAPPAEVALPRPVAPPPDVREKPKEVPKVVKKAAPPPPSQAANRAAAEVEKSDRSATNRVSQTPSPASKAAAASWQSKLFAHLERRKRYPASARARGIEGVLKYTFTIDTAGNVKSVRIVQSSGYKELDDALLDLMQRASPVPAPPPGMPLTITASFRYTLR